MILGVDIFPIRSMVFAKRTKMIFVLNPMNVFSASLNLQFVGLTHGKTPKCGDSIPEP